MNRRKKGAQPGNSNATKDGRYSAAKRAQRAADAAQRRSASDAWAALMPPIDYAAICAEIKASKDAFEGVPRGFDGIVAALSQPAPGGGSDMESRRGDNRPGTSMRNGTKIGRPLSREIKVRPIK